MKPKRKVIGATQFRLNQQRVCMYVDKDVLAKIRVLAEENRMKYQPFINRLLRQVLMRKSEDV